MPLPPSVRIRLLWYEKHNARARVGFYVIEGLAIIVSAAIPASAAAGATASATGILGGVVTALIGLGALVGFRESWVRYALTRAALQTAVVHWSVGIDPYTGTDATTKLVLTAEKLVSGESASWAAERLRTAEQHDSPAGARGE
jgi:hypothetical protein